MPAPRTTPRPPWLALGAVLAIGGLSAWLRWPGFTQGGFVSHDVGGILHESLVLAAGGLPYVDTAETKAPGSFYLGAWLTGGTDIAAFQVWANLWALGSLAAVAAVAWRVGGPSGAVGAALLYGLHDAHLDSMDANYVTWAQLPLVAAVGAALTAPSAATGRRQRAWWMLAGGLGMLAALFKRPAAAGAVVVLLTALWPMASDRLGRRARVAAVLGGGLVACLPLCLHYAAAGELSALLEGYVFNRYGMSYVQEGVAAHDHGLAEGGLALAHFLPLPLALAATAIVPPQDASERRAWFVLAAWTALTLAAASIGLRFYKGYFLAVAAPLCVWATAPWGLLGARARWPPALRAVLLLPALLLAMRQMVVLEKARADRARPHDQGARVIARVIGRDLRPDDRIWVWGWHLWDVYSLTGTRSACRVYKAWGLLTPSPDNTWRRPGTPPRFIDGPDARSVIDDLRAHRPAWIVLGSTVPRREFEALRTLLRAEYVLDREVRLGRVQFWHRRDRAEALRARTR